MNKTCMRVISWILILLLITPFEAMPQNEGTAPAKLTKEEIAQMVAPIALYPDSLVAQILMASTYPLDVVEADRWVKQNPNLKGDSLDAAVKDKSWDPSVKSLCHFPDVLSAMSQNLDKTSKLGDAVLSQQKDVMDVIQELRAQAKAQGNLKTTEQQIVSVDPADPQVIVIQPADPQVVYVPSYSPTVVYGAWPYPAYPPYGYYPYYPGAALAGAAIGFGVGLAVGAAWGGWSHCNWGGGDINVDYNRTNNFNRNTNINRGGNQNWKHNSANRRGVAYRDNATAQRYGQSPARSRESRQSRGYGGGTSQQGQFRQGGAQRQARQQGGSQPQRQSRQQGQFQQGRSGRSSYSGTRGGSQSAFSGAGNGRSERMASQRGQSSRSQSFQSGGSRGSFGSRGGSRGGGYRGGGGSRGGGRGGGGGRRR